MLHARDAWRDVKLARVLIYPNSPAFELRQWGRAPKTFATILLLQSARRFRLRPAQHHHERIGISYRIASNRVLLG